jgi:hypothetical protein
VELGIIGLALSALLAVAARDVGRPGRASPAGLLGLRVVGGAGLTAMAVTAVLTGYPLAALVAALGAAPLVAGVAAPVLRRRAAPPVTARETLVAPDPRYAATAEERRAA